MAINLLQAKFPSVPGQVRQALMKLMLPITWGRTWESGSSVSLFEGTPFLQPCFHQGAGAYLEVDAGDGRGLRAGRQLGPVVGVPFLVRASGGACRATSVGVAGLYRLAVGDKSAPFCALGCRTRPTLETPQPKHCSDAH